MSVFKSFCLILLSTALIHCVEIINLGGDEVRCVEDDGSVNGCPDNFICVGTRCENADGCVAEALECDALACGNDSCGEPCPGQCSAGDFCAADQSFCGAYLGYSDDFGFDGEIAGGYILGHAFKAPEDGEIKELGVLAPDVEDIVKPEVEIGIYSSENSDGTFNANALLYSTGLFRIEPGINLQAVKPGVEILGGTFYWLLIRTTNTTQLRRGDSDSFPVLFFEVGDEPMPLTLTGEIVILDYAQNIFATYEKR